MWSIWPKAGRDSDSLDDDDAPCERRRIWQAWDSDEWRTDFPPPAGFDGDEKGHWEDPEGYSRSLTAGESLPSSPPASPKRTRSPRSASRLTKPSATPSSLLS